MTSAFTGKYLILAWAILMAPMAAWGEPARVLSGEHATFSRLVTPTNNSQWSVTQEGRRVTLNFDGYTGGFDTSGVFDLIPQDRVQSISAGKSEISLTLACDCVVSVTTERDLYVVLDVAANIAGLETPRFAISQGVDRANRTPTALANTPLAWPRAEAASSNTGTISILSNGIPLGLNPDVALAANPNIVSALQSRLTDELDTAARRGVLTPAAKPFSKAAPRRNQIDTHPFGDLLATSTSDAVRNTPENRPKRNLSNLRISTSRDLPQTFRHLAEITNSRGEVCLPDTALAVASWGDTRPFADQIAEARDGLYGEFDLIQLEAAIRLAKSYLYFGFGAEARDVLELDPEITKNVAHLITLAQIMDSEAVPRANALAGLTECAGETAFWATLVAPMPPEGALPPPDDSLRTLNALPSHLRQLLAPKLHRVLLAYGNPDGAEASLRSLQRLSGEMPPAAQVAQAKGKLEQGKTEKAAKQLAEIVAQNSEQSPMALIALVETRLKAGHHIAPETASLVAAYAQELRESDLGPELQRIQILSLAQSGQFDAAFAKLNTKTKQTANLRAQVLGKLTAKASDIVFLDHALAQENDDLAALTQTDRLAFANRFLDLGFAADAERSLAALPSPPRHPDHQLLAARVSLAMGKPFRAQADILNLQDEAAKRLRADAKRMSGAHNEAHVLYSQINSTNEAIETAFLAEDWRTLTRKETPTFGATATLPAAPQATTGTTGMLARTTTLLEHSAQTRQTLQDLLNAEDLQIEPPTQ